MATFNSTQTGNWNDGGTWGNTSPGVGGVDYPGVTGDVVNIGSGHVVSYDAGASVVEWGSVTVDGSLVFPTAASSDFILTAAAALTVNSGGVLQVGTASTPVGAGYVARLLLAHTASGDAFVFNDGADISVFGDAAYYGNTPTATLKADWTSGQAFVVDGDVSAWPVGGLIAVPKNSDYASYSSDVPLFTIASAVYNSGNDETTITINEAAPAVSFYATNIDWTNLVFLLSRNVVVGWSDPAATQRSYLKCIQTESNNSMQFAEVQFQSLYGFGGSSSSALGYGVDFTDCTSVHCRYAFQDLASDVTDCIDHGSYRVFYYSQPVDVTGLYVLGSQYGIAQSTYSLPGGSMEATAIHCSIAVSDVTRGAEITAISCSTAVSDFFYGGKLTARKCNSVFTEEFTAGVDIDGCGDVFTSYVRGRAFGKIANCTNIMASGYQVLFSGELDAVSVDASNMGYENYSLICENTIIGGTFRPYTLVDWQNSVTSVYSGDTGFQTLPSGNDWGLLCTQPAADSSGDYKYSALDLNHVSFQSMAATVGDSNFALNIYPSGFAAALTAADLVVTVFYHDGTGGTVARSVNAAATYANDSWSTINVPITPGKDSFLYWQVTLAGYGGTVLIDPVPVVS